MRVVLDTNVLIAALIARGVCTDLLEHCVLRHSIVSSDFILGELHRHLVGKFEFSTEEAREAVVLLRSQMEMVIPQPLHEPVCRDPDDDSVLATAVTGRADCLVTGDKDLLVIRRYETVEIVQPGDFAEYEVRRGL